MVGFAERILRLWDEAADEVAALLPQLATPQQIRVVMSKGGGDDVRAAFLNRLDDLVRSLATYSVVTPDATFLGFNFTRRDYRRTAENGAALIVALLVVGAFGWMIVAQSMSSVDADDLGFELVDGEPLDLTYTEFELLRYLMQHPGRVLSRETLVSQVWGYDYYGGTRTVELIGLTAAPTEPSGLRPNTRQMPSYTSQNTARKPSAAAPAGCRHCRGRGRRAP